jgi:uncharacterized protein (DUF342 family)
MDGLSLAASVASIIEISGRIFDLYRTYYSEMKNAKEDIRRLRDEITSFENILTNVTDLADAPDSTKLSILDLLNQLNDFIQQYRTELKRLATKLDTG